MITAFQFILLDYAMCFVCLSCLLITLFLLLRVLDKMIHALKEIKAILIMVAPLLTDSKWKQKVKSNDQK